MCFLQLGQRRFALPLLILPPPPFPSPTCSPLDPSTPSPCRRESSHTRTSLYTLLSSRLSLPSFAFSLLSGSESDSLPLLSICRCHSLICFSVCLRRAVERQQTSNGRSVLRSACVARGWLCTSACAHICTDDKGNCASSSTA